MMSWWKVVSVAAIGILLFLIGIIACEGPQGPSGSEGTPRVYVTGELQSNVWFPLIPTGFTTCSDPIVASVQVTDAPSIPSVTINGVACDLVNIEGDNFIFYNYDLPVTLGDSAHLSVNYTKSDGGDGLAESDIIMPGPFAITAPDTSSTVEIPLGSDLTVNWTPSQSADVYVFDFYLYCSYYDTLGEWSFHNYNLDSLLIDTTITIQAGDLFPNEVEIDSLIGGSASLYLYAQHGPWQEGALGNITGDGIGFFYGLTFGNYLSVDVVDPD